MTRWTLGRLGQHDQQNGDCAVRELEMAVDAALYHSGYSVQFWRDVELYGVQEAIAYVRNGKMGDHAKIQEAWDSIRERLEAVPC